MFQSPSSRILAVITVTIPVAMLLLNVVSFRTQVISDANRDQEAREVRDQRTALGSAMTSAIESGTQATKRVAEHLHQIRVELGTARAQAANAAGDYKSYMAVGGAGNRTSARLAALVTSKPKYRSEGMRLVTEELEQTLVEYRSNREKLAGAARSGLGIERVVVVTSRLSYRRQLAVLRFALRSFENDMSPAQLELVQNVDSALSRQG